MRDGLDVGELPLDVPVLVEQVIVTSQLLRHFADEVQILLGLEPRNEDVTVALVHYFHVDEPLARHHRLHEPEVEAPYHDDAKDDTQRCHDYPILNIVDVEDLIVLVGLIFAILRLLQAVLVILLQE